MLEDGGLAVEDAMAVVHIEFSLKCVYRDQLGVPIKVPVHAWKSGELLAELHY